MPQLRYYMGRLIKRTKKIGDKIVVFFKSPSKEQAGKRIVLPLITYLNGRTESYKPAEPAKRASLGGS